MEPLTKVNLGGVLPLLTSGKVREVYEGIPQKGKILNLLSLHWAKVLQDALGDDLQTHFLSPHLPERVVGLIEQPLLEQLKNRAVQVRRLKPFPIEVIVRGYITGSAWKEYQSVGTVHGIKVSGPNGANLREGEKFERPIYTPSTKAEDGEHDENIHPDKAAEIVGADYAKQMETLAIAIYEKAHEYALARGIIIADTKFEFAPDGPNIVLIDEILTPDSSRFWSAASYKVGLPQKSFDKQGLRDYLVENGLKGKANVELPEWLIRQTSEKYIEVFEILTGKKWEEVAKMRGVIN